MPLVPAVPVVPVAPAMPVACDFGPGDARKHRPYRYLWAPLLFQHSPADISGLGTPVPDPASPRSVAPVAPVVPAVPLVYDLGSATSGNTTPTCVFGHRCDFDTAMAVFWGPVSPMPI